MSGKKITDQDYLFLSAMLSARQSRILSRETMERMIDAPSFEEAAKLATEHGFEDMSGMDASGIEASLSGRRTEIYSELERIIPEKQLINIFRMRFDYHNAKVLIKAQGADVDGSYLLSNAGRVAPQKLTDAYHSEDYQDIPHQLKTAITEAKSVLNRTENPQLADFILDRAYFTEMLQETEGVSSGFLRKYVGALADSVNIRAAVRTRRMGRDVEFLRRALVPGGSIDEAGVLKAFTSDEGLELLYKGTVFQEAAAQGSLAIAGGSLTEFELACDNALTRFLSQAKYISFGAEKVVAYLAALETELTAARMILTGKLSGVKPQKLRERLRDNNV